MRSPRASGVRSLSAGPKWNLGGDLGENVGPVRAYETVECSDGGHLAGVGRGGACRQQAAYAVAGHRDRSSGDLGLGGEELR